MEKGSRLQTLTVTSDPAGLTHRMLTLTNGGFQDVIH